jgi:anti-sigma B factor antagonist
MFAHSSGSLLRITVDSGRATATFTRPTRLTEETSAAVGRAFDDLVADPVAPHLTLDLGAVEFISSVALGQLVALNRQVRAKGGSLLLTNLRSGVHQVLVLTRLDRLLAIAPPSQALAS